MTNKATVITQERDIYWQPASRGRVGMFGLIAAESTIFAIFVVAYIFYLGKSVTGPQPRDVLAPPILYSVCLFSSSMTIAGAVKRLRRGRAISFAFARLATIILGGIFLYGTASEWRHLIYVDGLTISTNLFGTAYYSLVGLHGTHVLVGLIFLSVVMVLTFLGAVRPQHVERLDVLSLYWHFVDVVWVIVFTVVYVIGR